MYIISSTFGNVYFWMREMPVTSKRCYSSDHLDVERWGSPSMIQLEGPRNLWWFLYLTLTRNYSDATLYIYTIYTRFYLYTFFSISQAMCTFCLLIVCKNRKFNIDMSRHAILIHNPLAAGWFPHHCHEASYYVPEDYIEITMDAGEPTNRSRFCSIDCSHQNRRKIWTCSPKIVEFPSRHLLHGK
jgi:hypothetical protein